MAKARVDNYARSSAKRPTSVEMSSYQSFSELKILRISDSWPPTPPLFRGREILKARTDGHLERVLTTPSVLRKKNLWGDYRGFFRGDRVHVGWELATRYRQEIHFSERFGDEAVFVLSWAKVKEKETVSGKEDRDGGSNSEVTTKQCCNTVCYDNLKQTLRKHLWLLKREKQYHKSAPVTSDHKVAPREFWAYSHETSNNEVVNKAYSKHDALISSMVGNITNQ